MRSPRPQKKSLGRPPGSPISNSLYARSLPDRFFCGRRLPDHDQVCAVPAGSPMPTYVPVGPAGSRTERGTPRSTLLREDYRGFVSLQRIFTTTLCDTTHYIKPFFATAVLSTTHYLDYVACPPARLSTGLSGRLSAHLSIRLPACPPAWLVIQSSHANRKPLPRWPWAIQIVTFFNVVWGG